MSQPRPGAPRKITDDDVEAIVVKFSDDPLFVEKVREVDLGSSFSDGDLSLSRVPVDGDEEIGGAVALVLVGHP